MCELKAAAAMETTPFYITLPSNASKDMFPNNQISNYTVKLAKAVDLKGDWEVALTEIQYPRTWNTFTAAEAKFHIKREQDPMGIHTSFPPGYYPNITSIIEAINKSIASIEPHPNIHLVLDNVRRKVFLKSINRNTLFNCSGKLKRILGTVQHVKSPVEQDHTCPDINGGFYTLYVYSDIVESQRIGDSYSPLLRWVHVQGDNNTMVNIQFNKPDYVAVSKNHFDTISIMIYDDQSEPVAFKYGKVIVKLHLRPRHDRGY